MACWLACGFLGPDTFRIQPREEGNLRGADTALSSWAHQEESPGSITTQLASHHWATRDRFSPLWPQVPWWALGGWQERTFAKPLHAPVLSGGRSQRGLGRASHLQFCIFDSHLLSSGHSWEGEPGGFSDCQALAHQRTTRLFSTPPECPENPSFLWTPALRAPHPAGHSLL